MYNMCIYIYIYIYIYVYTTLTWKEQLERVCLYLEISELKSGHPFLHHFLGFIDIICLAVSHPGKINVFLANFHAVRMKTYTDRNGLRIQKKYILLVSKKLSTRIKKEYEWYQKNYPQKPIPSSTIERTTFCTIAHQLLTQMQIPMRRSPDCYCTYVGLSALIFGCMHVRTCACMSVWYMSVCMSLVDVCVSMCKGTNIKTPAEGLQTQDVAVRV